MSMMVVPKPLFNGEMEVEAYWLHAHDGTKVLGVKDNFLRMDASFSHPGLEIVERLGIEPFAMGRELFVDIDAMQLMSGVPERIRLPQDQVVYVLNCEQIESDDILVQMRNLKEKGYKMAISGLPSGVPLIDLVFLDYLVLNVPSKDFYLHYDMLRQSPKLWGVRRVLNGIPDNGVFQKLKGDDEAFFGGNFYSQPVTRKRGEKLSPVKVNALHLLNQVNQPDFDLEDIVKTIQKDPYLTFSLLRFINSSASGLSREVESISQAVAILGQDSVRHWATIALSASLGEDKPNEITKLALVRAKFAEEMALPFEMGVFQSGLFMAGLFSLLDVMLDQPMEEALSEMAISDLVKQVLVQRAGVLSPVMEMIYAYEQADWDKVSIMMIQNNTDVDHISAAYLEALTWYRNLLYTIAEAEKGPEKE